MITQSGVHPSLHPNCHHQIVFAKLNLKVEYPPLYEHLIWNYQNAVFHQSINRTVDVFEWGNSYEGINVHEQVHFFNKAILNSFHNHIPHKTIICNDKDPPWFNNQIRQLLNKKKEIFEQYLTIGKSQTDYEWLQVISNSLVETIRSSKEKFYYQLSTKLTDPLRHQKHILKPLSMAKKFK